MNLKRNLRKIEPDTRDSAEIPDRLAMDGIPSYGSMTATKLAR
jgi:hypothetical protein